MSPKDVIRMNLETSDRIIGSYIGDLTDADLLIRPVPGMNHIAWQLGHLIGSERRLIELIRPGSCPPLPEDFETGHGRDRHGLDDPSLYYPRARYEELWKTQRKATLQVLDQVPEEELPRTDPQRFPAHAPSVVAILSLCALHPIMHAGQFVAVRRMLGKPVAI